MYSYSLARWTNNKTANKTKKKHNTKHFPHKYESLAMKDLTNRLDKPTMPKWYKLDPTPSNIQGKHCTITWRPWTENNKKTWLCILQNHCNYTTLWSLAIVDKNSSYESPPIYVELPPHSSCQAHKPKPPQIWTNCFFKIQYWVVSYNYCKRLSSLKGEWPQPRKLSSTKQPLL